MTVLSSTTLRRLDIQGFDAVPESELRPVAGWLGLAFAGCAALAAVGTALASPPILLTLFPIAAFAAAFPVHPFDLIYNYGIRYITGTHKLPRRGAPSRFACGLGAVWLVITAWAFGTGHAVTGYVLGGVLVVTAALVASTRICVPSMIFRMVFGAPNRNADEFSA